MTKSEAIDWIVAIKKKYIHGGDEEYDRLRNEALDMAIEALQAHSAITHEIHTETHECVKDGDTIWRSEAIATVQEVCDTISPISPFNGEVAAYDVEIIDALESLPSADRPKGEWILVCDGEGECDNLYRCPYCGQEIGCEKYDKPKFCGECGADMRGDGE